MDTLVRRRRPRRLARELHSTGPPAKPLWAPTSKQAIQPIGERDELADNLIDKPTTSSSSGGGQQTNLKEDNRIERKFAPTDRLTLLDESESVEPSAALHSRAWSVQAPNGSLSDADGEQASQASQPADALSGSSGQLLLLLALGWLLLFSAGLYLYNWLHRERRKRRRRRKHLAGQQVDQQAGEDPSTCSAFTRSSASRQQQQQESREHSPPIQFHELQTHAHTKADKLSSIVTFKRRLARSSLLVAARSSPTRAGLMRARVRKFIDDEAHEMERRRSGRLAGWRTRTLSACLSALGAARARPTEGARLAQEAELPAQEIQQQQVGSTPTPELQEDEREQPGQPTDTLTPDGLLAGAHLSASPAIRDASSSISACSLLSFSPAGRSGAHEAAQPEQPSICGCSHALAARSRSQAATNWPDRATDQPPVGLDTDRLCCSVSPSALCAPASPSLGVQQSPAGACAAYSRHLHAQHKFMQPATPQHCHPFGLDERKTWTPFAPLAPSAQAASNHLKRQYENYYDDEHDDAYRRLTASIGMDFGFSFEPPTTADELLYLARCAHYQADAGQAPNPVGALAHEQRPAALEVTTQCAHCQCCPPAGSQANSSSNSSGNSHHRHPLFVKSNEGSAGELLSSASTSLGGSDSGFTASLSGFPAGPCRNPLCACQLADVPMAEPSLAQAEVEAPSVAPMSILVQQPSMATPPPPLPTQPQERLSATAQSVQQAYPVELACVDAGAEPICSSGPAQPIGSSNSISRQARQQQVCLPRWRRRRRLSQRQPLRELSIGGQLTAARSPRRMSIACDHLDAQAGQPVAPISLPQQHQQPSMTQALQHRASFAADGSCWTPDGLYAPPRSFVANLRQPDGQAASANSRRPSDAFLYETNSHFQYPGSLQGRSNHSSSGGSSSGIGVTGSACTNTPTSAFPYADSFTAAKSDLLDDFGRRLQGQQQADSICASNYRSYQLHCPPASYAHHALAGPDSGLPFAPSCAARKFSLPVQLESHAAERLSTPQRARPLFEQQQQPHQQQPPLHQQQQHQMQQHAQRTGLPGEAVPVRQLFGHQMSVGSGAKYAPSRGQQQQLDSRRSSQTITRQSSFWLEDNSIDSMLSLTTSLSVGQTDDVSQTDELSQSAGTQGQRVQQPSQAVHPEQQQQQRPSVSSLIPSEDSIDSVKQRPSVADESGAQGQQPELSSDAKGSSSSYSSAVTDNKSLNSSASTKESSASKSIESQANLRQPGMANLRSPGAHLRHRFSSSSTSSANSTSSPSPDLSRPGERILAMATKPKSSSIAKRSLLGRARARRFPRLGACGSSGSSLADQVACTSAGRRSAHHQHSAPGAVLRVNNKDESDEEPQTSEVPSTILGTNKSEEIDPDADGVFTVPTDRPTSDLNSASLERQCRDLWKLRATLHEDSCVADNWTNYHQRLNRRYDSGYKSIENQLSSSLEGNFFAPSSNTNSPAAANLHTQQEAQQQHQQSQPSGDNSYLVRPQSGCSGAVTQSDAPMGNLVERQTCQLAGAFTKLSQEDETPSSPAETIDRKLAELGLDDVVIADVMNAPARGDCNSRSSRSSDEEELKGNCDTARGSP